MKKELAMMAFIATLVQGCATQGNLYPVQGPLSARKPAPIYKVTINIPTTTLSTGTLAVTLQDGEVCSGSWAPIPPNDPTASNLSSEWDAVYGTGFFVANVLGNPVLGGATLTGTKGTVLSVQFLMNDRNQGKGVAKDNQGNVFKLTF